MEPIFAAHLQWLYGLDQVTLQEVYRRLKCTNTHEAAAILTRMSLRAYQKLCDNDPDGNDVAEQV